MNNNLTKFMSMKEDKEQPSEASTIERSWYLKGREGYPTASCPSGADERERGCFMMGWNTSEKMAKRQW